MTEQEKEFYSKKFYFSYSSLNKLLFSPSLFYKDYILNEREERIDKHLVEGKLIHCQVFEPENLTKKFKVIPNKVPTDNVKKILHKLYEKFGKSHADLMSNQLETSIIEILKEENLYQSLKEDSARLSKIQNKSNIEYWNYLKNPSVDIIDHETLVRSQEQKDVIMSNKEVQNLLSHKKTDFVLDPIQSYVEKYLECDLTGKPFGLKGYIDFYEINSETKEVVICDLKTTGKTISEFQETVEFYNYWLQAAIYSKLVYEDLPKEERQNYRITFKFIVIDKYNQVYVFPVSQESLIIWTNRLRGVLEEAQYHYTNNDYSLPYKFIEGVVL